jgi:hypothetical protein
MLGHRYANSNNKDRPYVDEVLAHPCWARIIPPSEEDEHHDAKRVRRVEIAAISDEVKANWQPSATSTLPYASQEEKELYGKGKDRVDE